ncbi:MAG: hypothetical protein AAFX85_19800, partial [Pseudomonadota bacterium]
MSRTHLAVGAACLALSSLSLAAEEDATAFTSGVAARSDHSKMSITELARAYELKWADKLQQHRANPQTATIPSNPPDSLDPVTPADSPYEDPLVRLQQPLSASPSLSVSFEAIESQDNRDINGVTIQVPDTNGDVGLDDIVSYHNLVYEVYTKTGASRGKFTGNALFFGFGGPCEFDDFGFPGGTGDYIVLYDEGRWVYKGWAFNFGTECIAITDGEDALGPVTRYEFPIEGPQDNDYPKLSVWTTADGSQSAYSLTIRNFGSPREATGFLFDRDAIRAGAPNPR